MAKTRTTAELTQDHVDMVAEMQGQDLQIAYLQKQIDAVWELLLDRMNGDGRVTKVMAKARGEG